jgi:hypothetical protein
MSISRFDGYNCIKRVYSKHPSAANFELAELIKIGSLEGMGPLIGLKNNFVLLLTFAFDLAFRKSDIGPKWI